MRRGNFLKLAIAMALMVAIFPGPATARSREHVTLENVLSGNALYFDEPAVLISELKGVSKERAAGARATLEASPFPYEGNRVVDRRRFRSSTELFIVTPRINTRYTLTVSLKGGRELSTTRNIWVGRARRKGPLLLSPHSVQIPKIEIALSRRLTSRWKEVPKRERTAYFYDLCGHGSYRLAGRSTPGSRSGSRSLVITYPALRFTSRCLKPRFELVNIPKLPGYLKNGDDGAGKPTQDAATYLKQLKYLGDDFIPRRVGHSLFGW